MADGNITSTTSGKVWTLRISIPNALNIGFVFDQFSLSSNAEMYIYDDAKTILDSAIKPSYFAAGTQMGVFPIKGNSIIVYIVELNNHSNFQSSVSIQKLEAGFQNVDDVGDQGSGAAQRTINCIPHVQCYPHHMMSARAVADLFRMVFKARAR